MGRALLVLALFLVLAAPAHAGGTLFAAGVERPVTAPRLAGDRVAWVTHSTPGFGVHVARHDGSGALTHTLGTPEHGFYSFIQLGASASRWAVSIYERDCGGYCRGVAEDTLIRGTFGAPLGERPVRLEPECTSIDESPRVDVWGDVVAYRDACTRKTIVHDYGAAPGEQSVFEYPEALAIQVAGKYLLTREDDVGKSALILREWRTGVERMRFDPPPVTWALQPDGKVGYIRANKADTYVLWRSPDEPGEHIVGANVYPGLLMADDKLVLVPNDSSESNVEVRRLDGSLVAASRTAGAGDFDGQRLTYGQRPCAVLWIATWDLAGDAPAPPSGRCPFAGSRRGVLTADFSNYGGPERRYGTTSALLECPSEPPLGCIGRLRLVAPDARPGRKGLSDMAYGDFALAPGEKRDVELRFQKKRICIAGRGALRPVLEIYSNARDGAGEERLKRRRVRLAGIKSRLCSFR